MYQRLLTAREARRNEDGFTLIELLIVIVILGVLAGIVVFGVGTFRDDATASAKAADCKTVSIAAEAWYAKNGYLPGRRRRAGDRQVPQGGARLGRRHHDRRRRRHPLRLPLITDWREGRGNAAALPLQH